jgi:signal peptidase I
MSKDDRADEAEKGDEQEVNEAGDEAEASPPPLKAKPRAGAAKPKAKTTEKTAKKPPESKARRLVRDVVSLLIFLGVALSARASLADHYVVPTGSMIPTVREGDRVFVSKAAYGFRLPLSFTWLARWSEPQRGDVVVLQSPVEDVVLLKRVVAVGGDEVTVLNGKLILNGQAVETTADSEKLGEKAHSLSLKSGGGPNFGPDRVPKGKVLVMGDNRGNSKDGRMFGFVDESTVLGRAVSIYLRDGSLVWDEL